MEYPTGTTGKIHDSHEGFILYYMMTWHYGFILFYMMTWHSLFLCLLCYSSRVMFCYPLIMCRGTGQTYWERPLYTEEKEPPLKGGERCCSRCYSVRATQYDLGPMEFFYATVRRWIQTFSHAQHCYLPPCLYPLCLLVA